MAKIYIVTYVCNPCDGNVETEPFVKKTKEDALKFIQDEFAKKCKEINFNITDMDCHSKLLNTSLPEAYINQYGDMYEWTTKEFDLNEI